MNINAPNTRWRRKVFWNEITNKSRGFLEEWWIIMGDFNTPLKENEKMGRSQPNLDSINDLMELIDLHLLHEMELQGINYSWMNKRVGNDLI